MEEKLTEVIDKNAKKLALQRLHLSLLFLLTLISVENTCKFKFICSTVWILLAWHAAPGAKNTGENLYLSHTL
jgi:hypothetical protein